MQIRGGLRRLLTAAVLAGCLGTGWGMAAEVGPAALEETRQYFGRLEKLGFAGTVLIAWNGEPVLAEGYGLADREHGVKWGPGTVSTIGSITKQFTAAAILLLEERGALKVQDPITRYFEGVPPDKQTITLHQLLSHSSGIVDLEDAGDFDPIGREEFVRRALAQPLAFPPGKRYEYSNAGYSLLGAIIEKLTGLSYERFVREQLFVPAGMYETGYLLPRWGEGRMAQGYTPEGPWGTVLGHPLDKDGPYWVLRANGGIHSTGYDMLRWARRLMEGEVLSPSSLERAWTPQVHEDDESSYGYGWSIRNLPGGLKVITHNGGNGVFFADLAIVPARQMVVFLQTNVAAELPMVEEILGTMGRRLISGDPYPELPDLAPREAGEMAAVAGTYRLGREDTLEVRAVKGALTLEPKGTGAFTRLFSTRPPDPARSDRLTRRMDKIVAAFLKGDFGPLHKAYGASVPLERLREVWTGRIKEMEAQNGALRGHEVLGTALQDERDITLVRFRFERGSADRAFVWDKEAREHILGISVRGLDPVVRCVPVSGGGYASWNPRSGESRPLKFDRDAEGRPLLRFGSGDGAIEAARDR